MFKISDGREYFYQWDLNRQLIVADSTIKEVHYCNRTDECSLVVDVIDGLANVPNLILQHSFDVRVFAYDGNATRYEQVFKVKPRTKPADYVYTETEIQTYKQLEARLDEIEEKGFSDEVVNEAVSDYLERNPVNMDGYATEQFVEEQIAAIPEVDLSDYAKIEDIPDTSSFISAIPKEYVTETELDSKGYATKTYVNDAIDDIDIPETEVTLLDDGAGNVTIANGNGEVANLSNYYTKTEVDALIPSLDGYAKTTDIPDVSAYQTEAQVLALIQANMPASGDEVSY